VAPPPSKYLPLAEWMRSKDSRLKWTEGIIMNFGRRIECFRGQQVLDALMNANFKNHSSLSSYASATRDELIATLDAMITEGFFTRVVALDIAKRPAADAPQELRVQLDEEKTFDVDALFMWTFESKSSAPLFKALGSIALVIFVCCFKVWPIWMRIVVWWLSLILLGTLPASSFAWVASFVSIPCMAAQPTYNLCRFTHFNPRISFFSCHAHSHAADHDRLSHRLWPALLRRRPPRPLLHAQPL
jgi:hypothetical protein